MRNRAKHAVARWLDRLGPNAAGSARCLVYHDITRHLVRDAGQMTTPLDAFRAQMDLLARSGVRVIDGAALVETLRAGGAPEPSVVLTFDDGLAGLRLALPVLVEHGFPATVFLIESAVMRQSARLANPWQHDYLTPADIAELGSTGLISFGSHSATHRRLPAVSDAELVVETAEAREWLQGLTGSPVELFAYPFGSFDAINRRVREAVAAAGYRGAFTGIIGAVDEASDPTAIPRCRVSWAEDLEAFGRLLRGRYDWYRFVQRAQAWR